MLDEDRDPVTAVEKAASLDRPVRVYPLFANALRYAAGRTIEQDERFVAEFWSRFSAVAARNPYAWSRTEHTADEVIGADPDNRMVAFPYTKLEMANDRVDQGAGFIMCSLGTARRRRASRLTGLIFPLSGSDANDHWYLTHRMDLHSSPAIRLAARRAFELAQTWRRRDRAHRPLLVLPVRGAGRGAQEIGLDLTDPSRPLTLTGGPRFRGRPGQQLRESFDRGTRGRRCASRRRNRARHGSRVVPDETLDRGLVDQPGCGAASGSRVPRARSTRCRNGRRRRTERRGPTARSRRTRSSSAATPPRARDRCDPHPRRLADLGEHHGAGHAQHHSPSKRAAAGGAGCAPDGKIDVRSEDPGESLFGHGSGAKHPRGAGREVYDGRGDASTCPAVQNDGEAVAEGLRDCHRRSPREAPRGDWRSWRAGARSASRAQLGDLVRRPAQPDRRSPRHGLVDRRTTRVAPPGQSCEAIRSRSSENTPREVAWSRPETRT